MSAERGSSFLLSLGSRDDPTNYKTVAGLKSTRLAVNGELVDVTTSASGGWRTLLSGAGVRSISVVASGLFTATESEIEIKALALEGRLAPFLLSFGSGERMTADFLITNLEYSGDFDGERTYLVSLESSGPVVTT